MPKTTQPLRIAIDSGGTFTDCVWQDASGRLQVLKVPSTPADPSDAIVSAIKQIAGDSEVVLLHGTTVGTNAVLERRGSRVAFVTTKGFEDLLEVGRQARPKLYDLFFEKIPPLVRAEDCFGVKERVAKDGDVVQPLSAAEVEQLATRLEDYEAIAVCLLFSFVNPGHEEKIAATIEALGKTISLSHRVLPEFREYERASTTVMNAYLQPLMSAYLSRLSNKVNGRSYVMQSNGGLATISGAAQLPVKTVLSGPAGGVVGATRVAALSGIERVIGFDMGGTSTDVWLSEGAPQSTSENEVAGLPVRVPMFNIHTIGAGGGSIAWFDAAGVLHVGPRSAGADPGPICYGKGEEPTVTDCNLLLGRLPATAKLAGTKSLDLERTQKLTREWLRTQKQDVSLEQFAEGVIRVVNSNMEKALRLISVEKGHDPRQFTLVSFGGAGALHACELAEELEIPQVLVPFMPGALSAFGILMSDVVKDFSRTLMLSASNDSWFSKTKTAIQELRSQATREFKSEGWHGRIEFLDRVDLRYVGQGYEIPVPFSRESLRAFRAEHLRLYGFVYDKPAEVVNVRVTARIRTKHPKFFIAQQRSVTRPAKARIYFRGGQVRATYLDRAAVRSLGGPALITEYSATTFVPMGWRARADSHGNLLLTKVKGSR